MAPAVHTPVDGYTGTVAGVNFANGVGETDDLAALLYFSGAGYRIEGELAPVETEAPVVPVETEAPVVPVETVTPATSDEVAPLGNERPERPHPVQGNKAAWFEYLTQIKPDHGFELEAVQRKALIEAADEVDGITAE